LLHLALNFFPLAAGSAFNPAILQVHLPGLLCEFLFGVIAWHVAKNLESRLVRVLLVIAGVGSWLALASVFVAIGDAGIESNGLLRGNMGLLSAMAFALVVCGVCGAISRPSGAIRWGPVGVAT
jgi:peptidoglycan/LPS O-acetylase OafA/YrhL